MRTRAGLNTAEFRGRTAVVTGGGSGIGESVAARLSAAGATVAVVDQHPERAERVAREIDGHAFTADVSSPTDSRALVERVVGQLGPVDVLVTSAGVTQLPGRPATLDDVTWDRVIDTDLKGTWLSASMFGTLMAQAGRGSIVTIASITALRSVPLHAYAPAKAGVISLTANLATEWARLGVRVNCVSPGYTLTPILREAVARGERDLQALEGEAAMNRLVEPDEVAEAVCFLASERASAITGVNLPVDCGWLGATSWRTYGGVPSGL